MKSWCAMRMLATWRSAWTETRLLIRSTFTNRRCKFAPKEQILLGDGEWVWRLHVPSQILPQQPHPLPGFSCEMNMQAPVFSTPYWIEGGHHRACRGADRNDNNPSYYQVITGIFKLRDCQQQCMYTDGCKGIEFSMNRCEIWTRDIRAVQYIDPIRMGNFMCMAYGVWSPGFAGRKVACMGERNTGSLLWVLQVFSFEIEFMAKQNGRRARRQQPRSDTPYI